MSHEILHIQSFTFDQSVVSGAPHNDIHAPSQGYQQLLMLPGLV